MSQAAKGKFEIAMSPAMPEFEGAVQRIEFTKTFQGDLTGTGAGVMLSSGSPQAGEAGYVAIETVSGRLGDRDGSFALQQFGTIHAGSQTLHYEIVPGSGSGALESIVGVLHLTVEDDGTHLYELEYEV
jgi:hypothetical protein